MSGSGAVHPGSDKIGIALHRSRRFGRVLRSRQNRRESWDLTLNAPIFLFRRDKSRLYGSLGSYASCRDREPFVMNRVLQWDLLGIFAAMFCLDAMNRVSTGRWADMHPATIEIRRRQKKDTLPLGYPNLVNESWYILSNPGTSWFRRSFTDSVACCISPQSGSL